MLGSNCWMKYQRNRSGGFGNEKEEKVQDLNRRHRIGEEEDYSRNKGSIRVENRTRRRLR